MIILLDTATPVCYLSLVQDDARYDYEWHADRTLARDLLVFLRDRLAEHDASFDDITGIGVRRGPGSFTGLRIGLTVVNTLADDRQLPIVGEMGDDWSDKSLARLRNGETDHIVMPEYGAEARVTTPRK